MGIIEGIILGAIQGISEFLPISSSGHLALFGSLILPANSSMDMFTEVLLHLGTLAAVLVVFAREAFPVFLSPLTAIPLWKREGRVGLRRHAPLKLLGLILLASIPAAIVGLLFEERIERLMGEPTIVAILLAVTGLVLLGAHWFRSRCAPSTDKTKPSVRDAVWIGISQSIAVLPGISRSGMTISAGLVRGLSRETAGVFSFLLFVPAIAGATLLQIFKLLRSGLASELFVPTCTGMSTSVFLPAYHIAGFVSSLVFGFVALSLLVRLLKAGRFHWFGWYCLAAALMWTITL